MKFHQIMSQYKKIHMIIAHMIYLRESEVNIFFIVIICIDQVLFRFTSLLTTLIPQLVITKINKSVIIETLIQTGIISPSFSSLTFLANF